MMEKIFNYSLVVGIVISLFLVSLTTFATKINKNPEETIIAKEQEALERWGNGDPYGYIDLFAPEMTYFDEATEHRIDSADSLTKYLAPLKGKIHIHRFEMLNTQVQLHGDVGILTYNLNNYNKDDNITVRWNSTEVYAQIKGEWKIIHSHWSLIDD